MGRWPALAGVSLDYGVLCGCGVGMAYTALCLGLLPLDAVPGVENAPAERCRAVGYTVRAGM